MYFQNTHQKNNPLKNSHQIKTGGDPRTLPEYASLRDELAKLNHPARPDVNWTLVEQLSLSLFRQNGVELQTLCWYTLARTRLAGMAGLNEGLAIMEVLLSRQWGIMWPQPVHARMEIMVGFSHRLQSTLRTLTLNYADLPLVYQAEEHLNALRDVLQRLELKNASQVGRALYLYAQCGNPAGEYGRRHRLRRCGCRAFICSDPGKSNTFRQRAADLCRT
ncbi:Uncharacterized protein conserved in bacteria [Cedecea neteri]|uniref:Uncharacterized protein conserved in bacteria n=1 Tax=Cedecea neteri TaxID=158822 RepID=A0A2X3JC08_9ENTR|nr:Uncharacterized protein conserved in bacteria [Cedecea neteri]